MTAELERETAQLQGADAERKALQILDKWFSDDKKPQKGRFADPALLFAKQ